MKHTSLESPDFVAFMGPTGSGKGTGADELGALYDHCGISYLRISSGQLVRDACGKNTYFGQKLREIQASGEWIPAPIVEAMIMEELRKKYKTGMRVILDGTPRWQSSAVLLHDLQTWGMFKKVCIVEMCAPVWLCVKRVSRRTREDKRADLSIDGFLGKPDPVKIKAAINKWDLHRNSIVPTARDLEMYACIDNAGTRGALRTAIKAFV